jgi:hypothetical protein
MIPIDALEKAALDSLRWKHWPSPKNARPTLHLPAISLLARFPTNLAFRPAIHQR